MKFNQLFSTICIFALLVLCNANINAQKETTENNNYKATYNEDLLVNGKITVVQNAPLKSALQTRSARYGFLIDNLYNGTGNSYSIACRNKDSETVFQVMHDGKVRIGVVSNGNIPDPYKLFVRGGILTDKCRVAEYASDKWADYVFDKDYHLNSLEDVEKFVETNQHLPNVPSAEQVGKEGFDLADMDATLLRQIEELWLHTIQINKEKEALRDELDALYKKVAALEGQK